MKQESKELKAENRARRWAQAMKEAHLEVNGELIVFTEDTLAYLIKKCLMTDI